MIINEAGGVQGPNPVNPYQSSKVSQPQKADRAARSDGAEISVHAKMMQKLMQMPELRQDKVDAMKAAIEGGSFDTDENLDAAVDKLMDELRGE